jgi:DNA-3-methyladenine glycosylase
MLGVVRQVHMPHENLDRDDPLGSDFYGQPAPWVAQRLIGALLLVSGVGGFIVETEAYLGDDPASHSYRGRTRRNSSMFGEVGRAYVYRSYGLHWCLNFVCGDRPGCAVLVRALRPTAGVEIMKARRGVDEVAKLCAGPGCLAQALAITREHDGSWLDRDPFVIRSCSGTQHVARGRRIGVSSATEELLRFGLRGSPYLSRPI